MTLPARHLTQCKFFIITSLTYYLLNVYIKYDLCVSITSYNYPLLYLRYTSDAGPVTGVDNHHTLSPSTPMCIALSPLTQGSTEEMENKHRTFRVRQYNTFFVL